MDASQLNEAKRIIESASRPPHYTKPNITLDQAIAMIEEVNYEKRISI